MIDRYIEFCTNIRKLRKRTVKEYFYCLRKIFKYFDPLVAKSHSEVEAAILRAKKIEGWGDSFTKKVSSGVLVPFYRWLTFEKIIEFNPYPFCRFKRPSMKDVKFISEEEWKKIINLAHLTPQQRCYLSLAWDTGVRKSELLSLNRSHVDLKDCGIVVEPELSKGGYSGRFCPFTKKTLLLLKAQIEFSEMNANGPQLFFNVNGDRLGSSQIDYEVRAIGNIVTNEKPKMRLHLHMIRHSLAGRLIEKMDSLLVAKIMGHKSMTVLNHYLHQSRKQIVSSYQSTIKSA